MCGSVVKNPPSNEGDSVDVGEEDFMPGSGRFPRGENSNRLQYSCLENPIVKAAWQAIVQERVRHDLVTEHAHRYLGR